MFTHRAEGYVQDERYIAGEHMDVRRDSVSFVRDQFLVSPSPRGSRAQYPWHCANLKEAAPAHPCARGIPFILNITASPEVRYRTPSAPMQISRLCARLTQAAQSNKLILINATEKSIQALRILLSTILRKSMVS